MNNKIEIVLAPTIELAKSVSPQITIEAEYGDSVVEGSRYTAAHHGSRKERPCPCVDKDIPVANDQDMILVSHVDLDTVGGVARALGHPAIDERNAAFWKAAAFVDIKGPHWLHEFEGLTKLVDRKIHTYWAWAQSNRGPRKDPNKVHDVTEEIIKHLEVLEGILEAEEDSSSLNRGDQFKAFTEALNSESYIGMQGKAIIRVSDSFVNHLYTTPSGEVGDCVVMFNTFSRTITLSFSEPDEQRNACEIMQKAFGPDAGGHKGIAGSPRGVEMTRDDLEVVLSHL